MNRVGVFSGTFDPFHYGHLESCLVAKSVCDLKTVLILIEKSPHRKQKVTSFKNRAEIIDMSTAQYPGLQLVDVDDDHVTLKNTLQILHNRFNGDEYWYILGSDLLNELSKWDEFHEIVSHFNVCIVLRNNLARKQAEAWVSDLQTISPGTKCEILPPVWSEVSSSKIRSEIGKTKQSKNIVPEALDYIQKHGLYQ